MLPYQLVVRRGPFARASSAMGRRRTLAITLLLIALQLLAPFAASAQFAIEVTRSEAAILIEAETGQVLYEKNADVPLPTASVAKLMTMLLTLESVESGLISWDDRVRISKNAAAIDGSQIWIAEGDTATVRQLFIAVAVASANDASVALAEHISGSEATFVQWMNFRAHELGMTNTTFINSHGYDSFADWYSGESLMSARDAAILARHIILHYPEVLEYTSQYRMNLGTTGRGHTLEVVNTNTLVLDPPSSRVDGLKTGHTSAAGYNLVATMERDGVRLISVVLRSESEADRNQETRSLLQWGFRFNKRQFGTANERFPVEIPQATEPAEVYVKTPVTVMVPTVQTVNIETKVVLHPDVTAPLSAGDEVGYLVVYLDGKEMGRTPAFVVDDVERMGFFARIWKATVDFFAGLFQ